MAKRIGSVRAKYFDEVFLSSYIGVWTKDLIDKMSKGFNT